MSYIKRWIDDECERIANETGYSWEDVMDAAVEVNFDMKLVKMFFASPFCRKLQNLQYSRYLGGINDN